MNGKNINAIIDLGSSNLKCEIFSFENNIIKSIAKVEKNSFGFKNSYIVNFEKACSSIRNIVSETEKQASVNLDNISIIFDPIDSITTRYTKFKVMEGSKIDKEDINFILRESKNQVENNNKNYHLIHMFNYKYLVDNKIFQETPINIYCDKFSIENIYLSISHNILKNIKEVFNSCDLIIDKYISSTYSSGLFLFNKIQLSNGCCLVDIGYEKTSLAIFNNLSLIKVFSFPIGSNHITKDISKICYLSEKESEIIKKDYISSTGLLYDNTDEDYLNRKYFVESKFRKISLKFLKDIISSRVNEILCIVNEEIENFDNFNIVKDNLIFTGGGSKIVNFIDYIDLNSSSLSLNLTQNNLKQVNDSNFIMCESGKNLLINGWPNEAVPIPFKAKKKGLFKGFLNIFN